MLIQVKYLDDGYDIVKKNILDTLIDSNKIVEFKRDSGWVKIGIDPIRKTKLISNNVAYLECYINGQIVWNGGV